MICSKNIAGLEKDSRTGLSFYLENSLEILRKILLTNYMKCIIVLNE